MISVKNLSKGFEDLEAIKSISLNVKKGSIYGLLGSNGAGKTTLLRILAGILVQDQGELTINDQVVFENERIKNHLFFIPDTPYFFSQYTTNQMAKFYSSIYSNWSQERFLKLQDVFQLDRNKKIQKFSKGMQRQVAFWLALSTMPDLLILDEPFDGLDPVMRRKVKNLIIQDVADREMTIIVSSHNLREVEDICDYVGIVHKGTMLLEKDLDDLKSDVHKIQVAFSGDISDEIFKGVSLLYKEERGSVILCIVRGQESEVVNHFRKYNPVIFDLLPLTLEEIFIYEMGDQGYAIQNILV
ncbi:ABC-2 type transport system ATP-binding protein [Bacillus mesophilus]|uniref:ABC transporter ATP-binding protein n=1 Tax=Bacillus mesophilus TaxID=1808955 RepID=A0A6M0Q727_9BACI|nr:ABC-2 type transport system ATP-binding protein [Bacillus mesophilus]NEY72135.1 ABC transporter ATP-binding protein [Bacillus mesophilus]